MTKEEALQLLTDSVPRTRQEAARFLYHEATAADIPFLTNRLRLEEDAHIRRAIVRVLVRCQSEPSVQAPTELEVEPDSLADGMIEDVVAEVTEQVTTMFLHEITPLVGAITEAAEAEFSTYPTSRSHRIMDRLVERLDVLSSLRRASSAPHHSEFDLTDLVKETISDEGLQSDPRVSGARDVPVIVSGAASHVRLALCNGLRNAVDAIDLLPIPGTGEVVINWAFDDRSAWITVLDTGIGLPDGSDKIFEFGKTTKAKSIHSGFGLPIGVMAMRSAGGRLSVLPRERGGTAFEIRWPLSAELD
jgi:signal transduction histidine kinase